MTEAINGCRLSSSENFESLREEFILLLKKSFPVLKSPLPGIELSPIEERFLFTLIEKVAIPSLFQDTVSFGKAGLFRVNDFKVFSSQRMFFSGKSKDLYDKGYYNSFAFFVRSQYSVKLEGKNMRIDFLLAVYDNIDYPQIHGTPKNPHFKVAIELDGHNFHEKTKEQAIRDKERDRILQQAGYVVLRYAGSEVWNDPEMVVNDIMFRIAIYIDEKIRKPRCSISPTPKSWKKPEW